jgi:hypothetical protein
MTLAYARDHAAERENVSQTSEDESGECKILKPAFG